MDIFDRLDVEQKRIECTPKNNKDNLSSPCPSQDLNVQAALFSPSNEDRKTEVKLLETAVIPVERKKLIWAPYYRYHNVLFCARRCSNEEALSEKSISVWPIPEDKAVVEIFCQDIFSGVTKLLLVEKKKIAPYFGSSSSSTDQLKWNETNLNKMKKVSRSYKSLVITMTCRFLERLSKRSEAKRLPK
jgi:hypothetical protein